MTITLTIIVVLLTIYCIGLTARIAELERYMANLSALSQIIERLRTFQNTKGTDDDE